jgi:hypothetical protein
MGRTYKDFDPEAFDLLDDMSGNKELRMQRLEEDKKKRKKRKKKILDCYDYITKDYDE